MTGFELWISDYEATTLCCSCTVLQKSPKVVIIMYKNIQRTITKIKFNIFFLSFQLHFTGLDLPTSSYRMPGVPPICHSDSGRPDLKLCSSWWQEKQITAWSCSNLE